MLAGLGPLLPGAADKRPLVGNDWEQHPGLSIEQLQAAGSQCICWHIGAAPGHVAIDVDGPKAAAFCREHGCDPAADTWRIVRTGNIDRLKLVFAVTAEQKAQLAAGGKTVKIDGEELAVFAKPGTQVVVLGQHFTKESQFSNNDDQYAWAGRAPADAQPLPPEWLALLLGVFCGDRPLRPATMRKLEQPSTRKPRSYSAAPASWLNSSQRQPCPICGRDHTGACSIHKDGDSVWCCHGETKSAPDCSKKGQEVVGHDGRTWAYVRTEDHDSFGERSLFVLHKPKPKSDPATPPLDGEAFIPPDAAARPADWQADPGDDEDDRQALELEISNFRDLRAAADLATVARTFPPGIASAVTHYANEQQLKDRGFLLPILCTVASIIGNRAHVAAEPGNEWTEPSIIWGANIADPGGGKSPTAKPATIAALTPWQVKERKKYAEELADWKHRRAQVERNAKAAASETGGGDQDPMAEFLAQNPQPECRHLMVSDATFEKIEVILANGSSPGLLAVHDELAQWFSQLCRSPQRSDRAKWLALYPGAPIITDRIGRESIFVPSPAVSLFGSLQPDRLAGLWKADAEANDGTPDGDGLWSRFLMFDLGDWVYKYRSSSTKLAPVLGNLYKLIDAAVAGLPPGEDDQVPVIALSDEALPLFIQWVDQLEALKRGAGDATDRQYLSKQRGNTLRLALAAHAVRQASAGLPLSTPIAAGTLENAILLTALFTTEREKVLAPIRRNPSGAIKRLLDKGREWRQQHGAKPVPQSQVRAWALPARGTPAADVRRWLQSVTASMPGCGQLRSTGRAVEWLPPGD
jgi:hypothetical protein